MRTASHPFSPLLKFSLIALVVAASTLRGPTDGLAQTFVIETADGSANSVGAFTSLALDASGNPRASYWDNTDGDLKYARKSGGIWTIETADGSGNSVGAYTSLALDASGNPHVSYQDQTPFPSFDLKYAWKSGGVWTNETADGSANSVGAWTSLALDVSENPHVSYRDATNGNLMYARKSGSVWTIETADGSANVVGDYTSLALDASGNPHVSYADLTNGDLRFARKSGGVWTIETADDGSANFVGLGTSLALDASGNPHVSHMGVGDGLRYARKSGGVWTIETADVSAGGDYTSLALDASGNPHVSYKDNATGDLKFARRSGGVWTIETADGSANSVGDYNSLALDASGNPHVSYRDNTINDLEYAYIPSVLIASPQAGATWAVGSLQTIQWAVTDGLPIGLADVFLSVDGGRTFDQIRNEARDYSILIRVPHAPTRFAQVKVIRTSSPFAEGYSDSFFTIDATIALNKFEARSVGDATADGGATRGGAQSAAARGVALTWETTPGREAGIRYRIERAAGGDTSPVFTPLTPFALDANEHFDAETMNAAGAARYRLIAINGLGEEYALGETAVAAALPSGRFLSAAPNPALSGRTSFAFRVAPDGLSTELVIYDMSGRRVATVASGAYAFGARSATWDGRSDSGAPVAAGVYFARLSWGGAPRATERVTVVR